MSDRSPRGARREEPEPGSFEEGRYLYCAIDASGASDVELSTSGIDGHDPYLVERDGVGVVVQACDSPYESTDVDTVKRWLLRHQAVVDDVGEAFGTPLPFRFDTIIKGDDASVGEWLGEESDALARALRELSGSWEYRVEVVRDRAAFEDRVAREDERLAELREARQDATGGTAFLVEKQYERRLRDVTEDRLAGETDALADRLRAVANEVRSVDRGPAPLEAGRGVGEDEHRSTLAVLAADEDDERVGDVLDEFAARPDVEVRFTGPWPPYTFAPSLGSDQ